MARLNKSFIDRIEIPEAAPGKQAQAFYRDSALPGFGLRITNTGAKAFIVEKRIDGKVKRITIGKYGVLTPEKARIKARDLLGDISVGADPIAEKRAKNAKGVTLGQAFESYLDARNDLKEGTVKNYRKCMNVPLADWKNKALKDITKLMVHDRHKQLGAKAPARANNIMRVLRAVFNHAMEQYEDAQGQSVIPFNPVDRLSHNRSWYRVEKRTGVLKAHELKQWLAATEQINGTSRDYFQLLLFTGLRKMEGASLSWDDIDLKAKTLTIIDTKNREPHNLPLSDYLYTMLQRRATQSDSPWVFPSKRSDNHLTEPRSALKRVIDLSGITFTLHDLRRTFITIAESLDVSAYALKRLANHKITNDITAGYIISDVERLRKPMQNITDFIQQQS